MRILLKPKGKAPHAPSGKHVRTDDPAAIERHLREGGNVGVTGATAMVLDWDDDEAMRDLFETLGELPLHVRTGSGKHHSYFEPEPNFPVAKIWAPFADGSIGAVGDIKRRPTEYVVCPPSIHPNGNPYVWLRRPHLGPLPEAWREYLFEICKRRIPGRYDGAGYELPEKIRRGERHHEFFRLIRSLKSRGHDFESARLMVLELNEPPEAPRFVAPTEPIVEEPLDRDELERFVARCWNQPDRAEFRR